MPKGYKFTEEHKRKISIAKGGKGLYSWTKEFKKEYQKNYRKNYKWKNRIEYNRIWNEKNREKKRELDRKYAKTTRKEIRKKRRETDPKYRLDNNMSSLISTCLRGRKANKKWQDLVNYKIEDLMWHLEKQFDDKMSWENYGSYWWIDHIKPRSLFYYDNPEDEEFRQCWALKNLQPLEKIANIKKGNHFKGSGCRK